MGPEAGKSPEVLINSENVETTAGNVGCRIGPGGKLHSARGGAIYIY